ncbi:MAG: hypothetical protein CMJ81_04830 [Planctomycetaceae bacterium]|nr:hypothetical protein [Planctomycetaceae bacterium]
MVCRCSPFPHGWRRGRVTDASLVAAFRSHLEGDSGNLTFFTRWSFGYTAGEALASDVVDDIFWRRVELSTGPEPRSATSSKRGVAVDGNSNRTVVQNSPFPSGREWPVGLNAFCLCCHFQKDGCWM